MGDPRLSDKDIKAPGHSNLLDHRDMIMHAHISTMISPILGR